jgi:hypothetical protein
MTTQKHNWERLAADRWPTAQIHGRGRYALRSERGDVYLYQTEAQARASAPFYDSRAIDLAPTPFPENCSTVHDGDADDRRRARLEKQSACGN